METVRIIEDPDESRRVLIIRRADGSYGFEEERFSDEPLEQVWIPFGRYSVSRTTTAELALKEAEGRVSWLVKTLNPDE